MYHTVSYASYLFIVACICDNTFSQASITELLHWHENDFLDPRRAVRLFDAGMREKNEKHLQSVNCRLLKIGNYAIKYSDVDWQNTNFLCKFQFE